MTKHDETAYYRTGRSHHLPRTLFARASVLSFLAAASVIIFWMG